MHKPIRREFLRKLVKIKKYEYLETRKYKYFYLTINRVKDRYLIFRCNKNSNNCEYIGIWDYK